MVESIISFFQTGGYFMYPIALVMVFGLVIAVERWLFLSTTARSNTQAVKKLQDPLENNDLVKALKIAKNSKAFAAALVSRCIEKSSHVHDRADLESVYEEGLMEVCPRLAQRTQYLATLANIATLLGLLGTIIGLIAAFTAVASADPSEKASLLSQSISVAMNTTAFGLMTAIPLLLCHSLLQSKATRVVESLQVIGVKCVNSLRQQK